jgi:excisionase family DNA binding protein
MGVPMCAQRGQKMKVSRDTPPLLVSVMDAATLLGVSRRTVGKLISHKKLSVKKIGTRTLIPYSALTRVAARGAATNPIGKAR